MKTDNFIIFIAFIICIGIIIFSLSSDDNKIKKETKQKNRASANL